MGNGGLATGARRRRALDSANLNRHAKALTMMERAFNFAANKGNGNAAYPFLHPSLLRALSHLESFYFAACI